VSSLGRVMKWRVRESAGFQDKDRQSCVHTRLDGGLYSRVNKISLCRLGQCQHGW